MALKTCKECNLQVSSDAKACPHCGKKNPTGSGVNVKWVLIGVLVLSVYTAINMGRLATPPEPVSGVPTDAPSVPSQETTVSAKEQALSRVKLTFAWRKNGFDTGMIADFTITNPTKWRIKDLEITCEHIGPSGTKIDSNVRTIFQIVEAERTKQVKAFNMGFIHSQATSSACTITNLVVVT